MDDVLKRILELKKNIKDTELENALSLKPKTIDSWKRGNSKSYNTKLSSIADYFNVSVDYLLGRETPALHIPDNLKGIPVAFHGGVEDLTQEDIDDVAKYIEFVRQKRKNESN